MSRNPTYAGPPLGAGLPLVRGRNSDDVAKAELRVALLVSPGALINLGVRVLTTISLNSTGEQWFLWWLLAGSYPGPGNQGKQRYEQKNVEWQCNGTDSTTWAGTTVGTIVVGGENARVYQD